MSSSHGALPSVHACDGAPRDVAVICRGLLDDAGIAATGGIDLPPAEMTLF